MDAGGDSLGRRRGGGIGRDSGGAGVEGGGPSGLRGGGGRREGGGPTLVLRGGGRTDTGEPSPDLRGGGGTDGDGAGGTKLPPERPRRGGGGMDALPSRSLRRGGGGGIEGGGTEGGGPAETGGGATDGGGEEGGGTEGGGLGVVPRGGGFPRSVCCFRGGPWSEGTDSSARPGSLGESSGAPVPLSGGVDGRLCGPASFPSSVAMMSLRETVAAPRPAPGKSTMVEPRAGRKRG